MLRAFVLVFCLSLPAMASTERPCWYAFVRDEASPAPDPQYVLNQQAAQQVFLRWWRSPGNVPFLEMMREAHRAALAKPYAVPVDVRDPRTVPAGVVRADDSIMLPLSIEEPIVDAWVAAGAQLPFLPGGFVETVQWVVALDGIPDDARPRNRALRIGHELLQVKHQYPDGKHQALYVAAMERALGELRRAPTVLDGFSHLVDYYQLGVEAHLFQSVNNSLLMGQVNGLLDPDAMTHGRMDFMAMGLDSALYRRYVRRRFQAERRKH